ncbi:MAG: FkbM family methyltransferase [Salinivirgaceae bacterium]|nr:FkbM family methyltransferase [Salinivirgaceae bacterium]
MKYQQQKITTDSDGLIYMGILKRKIIEYYMVNPELPGDFSNEISHIKNTNDLIFPYKKTKTIEHVSAGIDSDLQMPYVIHNGKKLYFPAQMTIDNAIGTYRNYIENENILGGGYREKEPHKYESEQIKVEDGDVLLDIGCAEALFALDHIEKVKKVYLIESDPYWIDALNATFKPYADKVTIVRKYISDKDTENSVTLKTLLQNDESDSLYIKMDIEGYERMVLDSSIKFLAGKKKVKMACCTYHRAKDFDELSALLASNGFRTEASDGYMIFPFGGELQPPYFRKGVLRAEKKS